MVLWNTACDDGRGLAGNALAVYRTRGKTAREYPVVDDVDAAGGNLFAELPGQLPFQDQNRVATAQKWLTTDPVAPSSKIPDIPPAVDSFVLRLLKRNRDERHPTAKAVIADLAQIRSSLR
jgi:serine/threonine protein kinase